MERADGVSRACKKPISQSVTSAPHGVFGEGSPGQCVYRSVYGFSGIGGQSA